MLQSFAFMSSTPGYVDAFGLRGFLGWTCEVMDQGVGHRLEILL